MVGDPNKELVTVIRIRVLRLLARRGVIDDAEPLTLLPTDLAEREPALAELAMAAVSGQRRRRGRGTDTVAE